MSDLTRPLKIVDDEDCLDWDDEEVTTLPVTTAVSNDEESTSNSGLCVAICTLVRPTFFKINNYNHTHSNKTQISAVPAVIGSWCWPILVGSMLSVAASNVPHTLVDFFHGIQVAITLALMTNIVQFAWWTCKKRRKQAKTHMECFWSVYVLLLSSCLVLVRIAHSYHWTPTLEYYDENSNTNTGTTHVDAGHQFVQTQ